jgi:hypothetical protein
MTSTSAWIRPALFFLAVSAAATAIAVVIAMSRGSSPSTATTTTTTTTATTATTATMTVVTATTPTTTTPTPHPHPAAPGVWPPGKSGYTIVLESIPVSAGRAFAAVRAWTARRAGLPRVGVLASSTYTSLHPGYYVVFSGIYTSSAQASAALPATHAAGFPDAYQVRVSR